MCNFSSAKTKGKRYCQPPAPPSRPPPSLTAHLLDRRHKALQAVAGVAGGSQPPKGEKLYRYNGIAERTIRCVFARRFDCHCCCCWPSALCCNEASWRGTPKYGRIMPNISADNCADYEVNLSAAKRMSRHSKEGGVRDRVRRREREEEEEWEPAKVLWLWSLQVLAGLAFWLALLYFSDCRAKGWHA